MSSPHDKPQQVVDRFLSIARAEGEVPERPGFRILDFGSGDGGAVARLLSRGYDAHGCDVVNRALADDNPHRESYGHTGFAERCGTIEIEPYRLPFPDEHFDLVFSQQVFEHVMDYAPVVAEVARVTRPRGLGIHLFPSPWSPLEPHTLVPLAGVFQSEAYLLFWAKLGVRNQFQRGLSALEVAEKNHRYLAEHTNYLDTAAVLREFERHFSRVFFGEGSLLRYDNGKFRTLARALSRVPFAAQAMHSLHTRALLCRR